MYKCLTVVALVLLVLTGAMGLRNIVATNAATFSASSLSASAIWAKWSAVRFRRFRQAAVAMFGRTVAVRFHRFRVAVGTFRRVVRSNSPIPGGGGSPQGRCIHRFQVIAQ